eukprot:scaffold22713_cov139-Cylindrotheca_fusiformis.AAC.6
MKIVNALLAVSVVSPVTAKVVTLNDDNYERVTAGKTVFIKYFAPWYALSLYSFCYMPNRQLIIIHFCDFRNPGADTAIAEDWEKLADEWAGSDIGLIAEVDCTGESTQILCSDIEGFPTLKYGDPSVLDEYQGERDYDELAAFAKENLKPSCSPKNLSLCDEATKKEISKFESMSFAELSGLAEEVNQQIAELEDVAGDKIMVLESQINEIIEKYNVDSQKLKADSNFKYMMSILNTMEEEDEIAGDSGEL